jgi:hypothetical protein
MLGISGGVILMPILVFIFAHTAQHTEIDAMHLAMNTSLLLVFINSLITVFEQFRKTPINTELLFCILPGALIGVLIGSELSHYLSTPHVMVITSTVLVFLGLLTLYDFWAPKNRSENLSKTRLSLSGFCIGIPASFLGIGGGSLLVPVFSYQGVPLQRIISTSAIFSLVTSFFTLALIAISTLSHSKSITAPLTIINWYAVFGVLPLMPIGVRAGSQFLQYLPQRKAKLCLGALLVILGLSLLFN